MEKIPLVVVLPLVKNEEGKILAQIRNDATFPEKHNKWELSGGKVEFDETPEQAVVREAKEETGMDLVVKSMWPKLFTQYWLSEEKQKHFKVTLIPFVCEIVGGELIPNPDDPNIKEVRFISAEEINGLEWGSQIDKELLTEFSKI